MSRDDLSPSGQDLQAWLDDAASAPPGDFADVVRRATALDASKVSEADVHEAEALPVDEDELRARAAFGSLETFLDDAAAFVAAQGRGEPPPMQALPTSRSGWRRPVVAAAVLVAAAALLWIGRAGLRSSAEQGASAAPYAAASDHSEQDATDGQATRRERRPAPKPSPEPQLVMEPEAELVPEPEPEAELEPEPEPEKPSPRRDRPSLQQLDQQAREAWRAGDLDGARTLFERVVARGGRGERADIAYGDLFALARRLGDTKRLRRYWKRYAARFPRGRYIDDARAGLCRTASAGRRPECWRAYLRDRPEGTFRADAHAALAED